tara:strand:+ start:991 stop:1260 length:270 start_codon:yes stop_codon:yes gene_type:complete
MAKNGQERSNQIADQFMRMAARIKTPKRDYSIEGQMREIEERNERERLAKKKEAERLKAHQAKMKEDRDKYLIWQAKRDALDQKRKDSK